MLVYNIHLALTKPFSLAGLSLKDDHSVIETVQNMLQPDIERRLAAKKRLDDIAVSTLLDNVSLLKSELSSASVSDQPSTSTSSCNNE